MHLISAEVGNCSNIEKAASSLIRFILNYRDHQCAQGESLTRQFDLEERSLLNRGAFVYIHHVTKLLC